MHKGIRRPTREEMRLWRQVTRQDRPLHLHDIEEAGEPEMTAVASGTENASMPSPAPQRSASATPAALMPLRSGDYTGVDAATAGRLRRGQYPIDITLDLHGLTQEGAHDLLHAQVEAAYRRGQRCLLIITGKGGRGGAPGVLRAALPAWLNDARFRPWVLAFGKAAARHGGEGACYVLIRRRRDSA